MRSEGDDQDDHLECGEAGEFCEAAQAFALLAFVALLSEALALELALLTKLVVRGGHRGHLVHQVVELVLHLGDALDVGLLFGHECRACVVVRSAVRLGGGIRRLLPLLLNLKSCGLLSGHARALVVGDGRVSARGGAVEVVLLQPL